MTYLSRRRLGHGAPLQAGGIAAAAASAQAAFGDLLNHSVGRHLSERLDQRLVAVAGNVVVDLLRIDVAGVFQHHVHLLVEVLAQVALQRGHRFAAQACCNGFRVAALRADRGSLRGRRVPAARRRTVPCSRCGGQMPSCPDASTAFTSASFSLSECWLRQPVPMQTLISWSNFAFSGARIRRFVQALRWSFDGPPFQLLQHLLAGHLALQFAVGQHHRRAAARAHAARRHEADVAVLWWSAPGECQGAFRPRPPACPCP
jgi:hypothetical protein